MPRRGQVKHIATPPDSKFKNVIVQSFINRIMERGKKTVAERLVYGAFDIMAEKTKKNPIEVFESALRNAGPSIEVKPRRVGGATLQVPVEVSTTRRTALAMRWIIQFARARGGKTFKDKLAGELLDAAANQGSSIKKKEEVHKMAESNRAFAHYRF
ncbi:MAG: 30S ribosomal protein S7 [Chloroflexi bacterium]|nr:30S ribosomal protein S7 [Chloroflexota bacterium]